MSVPNAKTFEIKVKEEGEEDEAPKPAKDPLAIQPALQEDEIELHEALDNADEYEDFEDDWLEKIVLSGVVDETGRHVDPDVLLWGNTEDDLPDPEIFARMRAQLDAPSRDYLTQFGTRSASKVGSKMHSRLQSGAATPLTAAKLKCLGSVPSGASAKASSYGGDLAEDFDRLLDDEYGESEDGDLEGEEIQGGLTLEEMEPIMEQYMKDKQSGYAMIRSVMNAQKSTHPDDTCPRVIEETKALVDKFFHDEAPEVEHVSDEESDREDRFWDCETVLTGLSNLTNRPGKIKKVKLPKKIPMGPVTEEAAKEEVVDLDDDADDIVDLPDIVTKRPKDETPEEKQKRKAAVRQMKQICRTMKKETKQVYKQEAASLKARSQNSGVKVKPLGLAM